MIPTYQHLQALTSMMMIGNTNNQLHGRREMTNNQSHRRRRKHKKKA